MKKLLNVLKEENREFTITENTIFIPNDDFNALFGVQETNGVYHIVGKFKDDNRIYRYQAYTIDKVMEIVTELY